MSDYIESVRASKAGAIQRRRKAIAEPPGGFSLGTSWFGGPFYSDAFGARRAPSPWQLVERYGRLIYAMAERNKNAVSRLPLRLYADGSRVQGVPRRACEPVRVARAMGERFSRAGMISAAAVDQIYEIRIHPMLDVLEQPDPQGVFDLKSLIGLMVVSMDVIGSGYLVPQGGGWDWQTGQFGDGPPENLWIAYAQYVIPIRDAGSTLVRWWQYFKDRIPFESAIWFRQTVSLRDPYGSAYSPAYAGDMYQDQEGKFVAWYDQFFTGAKPNLLVTAKDPLMPPGEDARKRLEQDLNSRHAGGNAGNAIISNGAYDFASINYPPTDEGGMQLAEYDLYRLASIFGQPPTYYTVDTNLANLQAADEQHARNGVEPRCWAIAGKLTRFVRRFDPRLFFAFDPAIQEDSESKEKVISMRLASGRTTINQENEEDRWPPVAWGDEPWLPGTLKQPSMITEAHEMGLKQGDAAIKQGDAAVKQADKGLEHDGERVEIEAKKAAKPEPDRAAEKRALWERMERLRAEMQEAVR